MNFVSKHYLLDFRGCLCPAVLLNNVPSVITALHEAANRSQCLITGVVSEELQPYGLSVIMGLKESHISVHTFPQSDSVFIDFFTCGTLTSPERGVKYLKHTFRPDLKKSFIRLIRRGDNVDEQTTEKEERSSTKASKDS